MMFTEFFIAILTFSLVLAGCGLWRIGRKFQEALRQHQEIQEHNLALYRELARQVVELRHTLGGVVNSVDAMGNEVQQLNLLAVNALEGAQPQPGPPPRVPEIVFQIRRIAQPGEEESHKQGPMRPEDLPPELLERFKTFKAVYKAIISQEQPLCSQKRPELN